jgi:hypothetical protein
MQSGDAQKATSIHVDLLTRGSRTDDIGLWILHQNGKNSGALGSTCIALPIFWELGERLYVSREPREHLYIAWDPRGRHLFPRPTLRSSVLARAQPVLQVSPKDVWLKMYTYTT